MFRLLTAPRAFEGEGPGNNGDGERAEVLGDLRHYRRRPGAGAAAHARRDEHHIGALQRVFQLLARLFGRGAPALRVAADAEAACDAVADADAGFRLAAHQRLGVGVDADEVHARYARQHHAVDGVAAAAAHAHHLNRRQSVQVHIGHAFAPFLALTLFPCCWLLSVLFEHDRYFGISVLNHFWAASSAPRSSMLGRWRMSAGLRLSSPYSRAAQVSRPTLVA